MLVKFHQQPPRPGADVQEASFRTIAQYVPGNQLVMALKYIGCTYEVIEYRAGPGNAFEVKEF
jgi:hypothetical protein